MNTKYGSSSRNLGPGVRRTSWAHGDNISGSSNHSGDRQTSPRRRISLTKTGKTPGPDQRSSVSRCDGISGGEKPPLVRRPPLPSERPSLTNASALHGDAEFEDTSQNGESLDTGSNSHVSWALRSLAASPASHSNSRGGVVTRKYLPVGLGNSSSYGISISAHGEYKQKRTTGPENDGVSHSLHKNDNGLRKSSHCGPGTKGTPSPLRTSSTKGGSQRMLEDGSMAETEASGHRNDDTSVPYFEKLCWVCEELDYPFEYADIVGSQFLGLDAAHPVTHVNGHGTLPHLCHHVTYVRTPNFVL